MTEETYFFDTYAIMEVIQGNSKYEHFLDSKIIINDFIFAELCYNLLKDNTKGKEEYIKKYSQFISYPSSEVIEKATKMRYEKRKNDLSMTDCISYLQAKNLGIKFLTGDKEFENLENVEFVKK